MSYFSKTNTTSKHYYLQNNELKSNMRIKYWNLKLNAWGLKTFIVAVNTTTTMIGWKQWGKKKARWNSNLVVIWKYQEVVKNVIVLMLKMHKKGGLSIRGVPFYIFREKCEFKISYLKFTLKINFIKKYKKFNPLK